MASATGIRQLGKPSGITTKHVGMESEQIPNGQKKKPTKCLRICEKEMGKWRFKTECLTVIPCHYCRSLARMLTRP